MNKKGGPRRKTRYLLKRPKGSRGKLSIRDYFQKFEINQKVALSAAPHVQKGMYNPNFYGKVGIVKGKKGSCYEVLITDGSKQKTLIVHPIHLKKH